MHTLCAYANDIAGVDGGYLVIGVKAENGIPVLPPIGLPCELLDDIRLKTLQYCKKTSLVISLKLMWWNIKGVNLVYLKCAAGDAGPYQALVDVYSKRESGKDQDHTMKYWIRPASLTTEAKQSELAELFEKFASTPFVDRINKRIDTDLLAASEEIFDAILHHRVEIAHQHHRNVGDNPARLLYLIEKKMKIHAIA